MIVEELSDSTTAEVRRDTVEKKEGYARAGVKEYFILDPKDRDMHFYRLQADGSYERDRAGRRRDQSGHRFCLGLQFRREDLLREPPRAELARDDVYMRPMSFPNCGSLRPEPKRRKSAPTPKQPPDVQPKTSWTR